MQTGRNVVHGSDSPENGERETGEIPPHQNSVPYALTNTEGDASNGDGPSPH